jgi:hypothetical protein
MAKLLQPGAEAPGVATRNAQSRGAAARLLPRVASLIFECCCKSHQLQPSAHIDAGSAVPFANFPATRDGAFCPMFLRLRNNRLGALFIALKFFFAEAFTHLHQTQLELL